MKEELRINQTEEKTNKNKILIEEETEILKLFFFLLLSKKVQNKMVRYKFSCYYIFNFNVFL